MVSLMDLGSCRAQNSGHSLRVFLDKLAEVGIVDFISSFFYKFPWSWCLFSGYSN